MSEKKTEAYPNWLKRVQEQSWEPEILISGLVFVALTQLPKVIEQFNAFLELYSFPVMGHGNRNESILGLLEVAIYWLILGFSIHLILRSIWTAFVGLSYAYPEGPKFSRLRYPERYKAILEKMSDYGVRIHQIEL